jgi:hypothetical protein
MTVYSLILFIHVTAVLALFAAMALEALSLYHLRRAITLTEVRVWIDPAPGLPLATTSSLLLVLFSGIYLTIRLSAFGAAWPRVTIAAILLIAPLAAIAARRMRAIRRAIAAGTMISPDVRHRLQDPFLKVALGIRIAVILGIVLLMAAKPQLWPSVGIVGASTLLGILPMALTSRHSASLLSSGSGVVE